MRAPTDVASAGFRPIPFPPLGGRPGWALFRRDGLEFADWQPLPLRLNPETGQLELWAQSFSGAGSYRPADLVIDEGEY